MARPALTPRGSGLGALVSPAAAGSARSTFAVSAEVVRRCAIDGSGLTDVRVMCSKGTPAPRMSGSPRPAGTGPASATAAPHVVESAAPAGSPIQISVDF